MPVSAARLQVGRPGWHLKRHWTPDGIHCSTLRVVVSAHPNRLHGFRSSSRCGRLTRQDSCARPKSAATIARSSPNLATMLGRQLTQHEEATWQASCDLLITSLGLSAEDADRLLARGFGWTSQAFWRQEKVDELPTPDQVRGVLEVLLGDLNMTVDEAARALRLVPELLACDVERRLRANIQQLERQWRLQGTVLTSAVQRQPAVLGYSVDCGGDCIGECNRCWVRF